MVSNGRQLYTYGRVAGLQKASKTRALIEKAKIYCGFFCLLASTAFAPKVGAAAGGALSFFGLRLSLLLLT